MTAIFLTAFRKTMKHEGYLVNDPDDSGGLTWRGIARNKHPKWEGWILIDYVFSTEEGNLERIELILKKDLNLAMKVRDFYLNNYWHRVLNSKIEKYSPLLAIEIFDTAINCGVYNAVLFLQKSMNLLNRNQVEFVDIFEDGDIGSQTFNCLLNNFFKKTSKQEKMLIRLFNLFNFHQNEHYVNLMRKYPKYEKFRGWFDRISTITSLTQ